MNLFFSCLSSSNHLLRDFEWKSSEMIQNCFYALVIPTGLHQLVIRVIWFPGGMLFTPPPTWLPSFGLNHLHPNSQQIPTFTPLSCLSPLPYVHDPINPWTQSTHRLLDYYNYWRPETITNFWRSHDIIVCYNSNTSICFWRTNKIAGYWNSESAKLIGQTTFSSWTKIHGLSRSFEQTYSYGLF